MSQTLASYIRFYEQFHGGKSPSLRAFHQYLVGGMHSDAPTSPAPAPKRRIPGAISRRVMETPVFAFTPHQEIDARAFDRDGFKTRAGLDRLFLENMIGCGQYGCTYSTSHPKGFGLICKITPWRPHAEGKVGYTQTDFDAEIDIATKLGAAEIGPKLVASGSIQVDLLPGETFDFEVPAPGTSLSVFYMYMEPLRVIEGKGVGEEIVAKFVELGLDAEEVRARQQELVEKAQDLVDCPLDVDDVEWGLARKDQAEEAQPLTVQHIRLFDVACKISSSALAAIEGGDSKDPESSDHEISEYEEVETLQTLLEEHEQYIAARDQLQSDPRFAESIAIYDEIIREVEEAIRRLTEMVGNSANETSE